MGGKFDQNDMDIMQDVLQDSYILTAGRRFVSGCRIYVQYLLKIDEPRDVDQEPGHWEDMESKKNK